MTSSYPEAKNWQSIVQGFLEKKPKKPLLVLIGPTASGKTALSIELALWLREQNLPAEIVNADSRQLYKFLDIGTAKITEKEMKGVPHHLLSALDPKAPVTIAWYQKEAASVIVSLHQAQNLPILVGGSMLYVSSIVDGLQPMPSDSELRKKLEMEYDKDFGISLYQRLLELDPETAVTIPRENRVYVVRAMEMIESTGKKKSEAMKQSASPYSSLILGMEVDREVLKKRIEDRVKLMFESGWIEEVKSLLERGYKASDPAMLSHGYKEIIAALEAGTDPTECIAEIAARSWQYARRHITWWRGDERVRWIAPSPPPSPRLRWAG